MADFVRDPGEVEVLRETVAAAQGSQRTAGWLVLTDRRIVLLAEQRSFALRWMYGEFLGRLVEDVTLEMTHEIERDDFAAVEPEAPGRLGFHSKGDRGDRISFVVYTRTACAVWRQRMQRWARGTLGAAPLPGATLHRSSRPAR